MLKDSSVRSIWTYLTARERERERGRERDRDRDKKKKKLVDLYTDFVSRI